MSLKKSYLLFIFLVLSFISSGEEKINPVDYMGFYTRNLDHYVKVGNYEDIEFQYPSIKRYRVLLGKKEYPIVLIDEKYSVSIYSTKIGSEILTNNKEKLKSITSFSQFPKERISYFFQGDFLGRLFSGKIVAIYNKDSYNISKKATVLLFEGKFVVNSLAPGISSEYNYPIFNLSRVKGTNYSIKKYKYSISKGKAKIYDFEEHKLRNSLVPDERSLAQVIELYK